MDSGILRNRSTLLAAASILAVGTGSMPTLAQAQAAAEAGQQTGVEDDNVIVVTGFRASLEDALNAKRESNLIIESVTAEDIGKFPDTNLAESLQRITGVSINRVNGEGSEITVRGFGPGFNLVTLNGRTMPTAKIRAIGTRGNYGAGGDRAFDFSNLASEGVSGLEVYKTGQAILPSGGIGATVNLKTRTPFDDPGLNASFSAKAINDTSVEAGDDFTPELSGLASWTDPSDRFGIGIFGSYSKRDSGAPSQQVNDWIVRESADGTIDGSYTRGDGSTQITNPPAAGQLYAIPQDSRYDFSDISRERLNGQLVLQFRPIDNLTLTGDYTYAMNESDELRYEQTNWFATPLDQIIFDNDGPVATAVFMQENNNGSKDIGFEQTNRATKDELNSFGFNADWEFSERGTLIFDAHSSKSESGGNNPLGHTATFVTMGAPVILQHSVDFRGGTPIQSYTIDDSVRGNGNGVLDAGDLGTQVQRSNSSNMQHEIDEFDLRFVWDFDDRTSLTVGSNFRDSQMDRTTRTTQQDLGSWGISNPGDVEQFAPGVMQTYCLSCLFDDVAVGQADTAFRVDATQLYPILEAAYAGNGVNISESDDTVQEEILSFYAQFNIERDFMGLPTRTNIGVRYEDTNVKSTTVQSIPSGILWQSDNDFLIVQSGAQQDLSGKGAYEEVLPNADFQIDLTENLVARTSFSKTIGRAGYSSLFASTTANAPNRPTAFGGSLTGDSQNPGLLPLKSTNFDISLEWYYGDTSYVSAGYFDKKVKNFIGNGVVERNLFGLRDPASGASGSRSGDALAIINALGVDQSEANLFTLTALIDANGGDTAAARAEFESQLVGGALPQSYVDQILGQYDVASNGSDPLAVFGVNQPVNNREGNIDGMEFAWQHFFGETGFGFQANYTLVNGDVELNPAASINDNQFALVGLSDTANLTAIYEKYGFSARLAYNWRDTFLLNTNQGGDRSGTYVEDYGQYDLNVSYDINEQIAVSFEGINLTGEDQRIYHRVPEQVYYVYELAPRYQVGVRYKF